MEKDEVGDKIRGDGILAVRTGGLGPYILLHVELVLLSLISLFLSQQKHIKQDQQDVWAHRIGSSFQKSSCDFIYIRLIVTEAVFEITRI